MVGWRGQCCSSYQADVGSGPGPLALRLCDNRAGEPWRMSVRDFLD